MSENQNEQKTTTSPVEESKITSTQPEKAKPLVPMTKKEQKLQEKFNKIELQKKKMEEERKKKEEKKVDIEKRKSEKKTKQIQKFSRPTIKLIPMFQAAQKNQSNPFAQKKFPVSHSLFTELMQNALEKEKKTIEENEKMKVALEQLEAAKQSVETQQSGEQEVQMET